MTEITVKSVSRRRFLKSGTIAAGTAAGALAIPNIVRAQDATVWKFQSTIELPNCFIASASLTRSPKLRV